MPNWPSWHPYARHLREHPLCRNCALAGRVTVATMVTRIGPIERGQRLEEPRSLCRACWASGHEGWLADTGDDGWPLDDQGKGF
jgi:hypothetical protein